MLPSRSSLDHAGNASDYGVGLSFGIDPELVKTERSRGWDWYYDADIGGRKRRKQRMEEIGEDDARRIYLPSPEKEEHTVIVGPVDNHVVFKLRQNESLDFGEAWAQASDKKSPEQPGSRAREGWILNVGSKIQCLEWAPNARGPTQYLAVVAPTSGERKKRVDSPVDPKASSFSPSPPYPSALRIYAFKAKLDGGLTKRLDMGFKPRLSLALCTDWGDLRRISWCPVARDPQEEEEEEQEDSFKIGLLAGIWGDGRVRVLDVRMRKDCGTPEFCKDSSNIAIASY